MQPSYLLDTDISSYAIKNQVLGLRIKHTLPSSLFISAVTAAELLLGVRGLSHLDPFAGAIQQFIGRAQVLSWDLSAAKAYADIRHTLTSSGLLIGELDMMIAAHALATGSILVSNNTRHFSRLVPPLQLENWTAP